MLNRTQWRGIGASLETTVVVLALALSLSLVDTLQGRVLGGPGLTDLLASQSGGTGSEATQASPGPSPAQGSRVNWSTVFEIAPGPYSRLDGLAEVGGALFALGRSDRSQPGIWRSRDGTAWTAAEIPQLTQRLTSASGATSELTAIVLDVEDAGNRLVALASVGLAEGGGPLGTMIYVSEDDGQHWTEVPDTPGVTSAPLFDLASRGDQLIAVGAAIWLSDDGGLSWTEVADDSTIGGVLYAADASSGLFVAAGDGGNGDLLGPPAIALVSTDAGRTWERRVIDRDAGALSVVVGSSGRVVVGGYRDPDTPFWVSDDSGRTWKAAEFSGICCAGDLVSTPNGYVAASFGSFDGVLRSTDGLTWVAGPRDGSPDVIEWGPTFGLTGAREHHVLRGEETTP
jgi:hypothetical protein